MVGENSSSTPSREIHAVGAFTRAQGGVIYGWIPTSRQVSAASSLEQIPSEADEKSVDIFVNGLHLGSAVGFVGPRSEASKADALDFSLRVPMGIVVSAPAVIRGRLSGTDIELSNPLEYAEQEELDQALVAARGRVSIKDGMVKGSLKDVNPDALPLWIICYVNGRATERTEVRKPRALPPSGQPIWSLPFSIALPPTLLDGAAVSVSVRPEGSDAELEGSPIIISISGGESVHRRLLALEALTESLDKRVVDFPASIVKDVADQFYRFIIPRVDAIVGIQRDALETQMAALWKLTSGYARPPVRRSLPASYLLRITDPFVGFGWSHPQSIAGSDERFFTRNAFLAVEIAPGQPLLAVVKGSWMAADSGFDSLVVTANGKASPTLVVKNREGWSSLAVLDDSVVTSDGALGLLVSTEIEGFHERVAEAVSASVGSVEISPAPQCASNREMTVEAAGAAFVGGWHGLEVSGGGVTFRWMAGHGAVFIDCTGDEPLESITLSGPMALTAEDGSFGAVSASFGGVPLVLGDAKPSRGAWYLRFDFPTPIAGPARGLLSVRAPSYEVPGDSRELSLAVSLVTFNNPATAQSVSEAGEAASAQSEPAA